MNMIHITITYNDLKPYVQEQIRELVAEALRSTDDLILDEDEFSPDELIQLRDEAVDDYINRNNAGQVFEL